MTAYEPGRGAASSQRVLLIEDEAETTAHVSESLREAGWIVDAAVDGEDGLERASRGEHDVIIVDRMLPRRDGLSLVGELRARRVQTPVLFLTAMGSIADRVAGLEGGGDDYLVKPISSAELAARVGALARRPAAPAYERTSLQVDDLEVDRLSRTVTRAGRRIEVLPLEYKLLEFLMLNAGRVVTRAMLLEKVWGFHFDPRTNIVETHISRLRAKIDQDGGPPLIVTVRGAGYVVGAV